MSEATITGYIRTESGQLEARTFWVEEDGSIQGMGGELLPIPGREPVELMGWAFNRAIEHAYDGEGIPVLIGQATGITRKQLVSLGGKLWCKGDQRRIYFNDIGRLFGCQEEGMFPNAKLWMDAESGEMHAEALTDAERRRCTELLEMLASAA